MDDDLKREDFNLNTPELEEAFEIARKGYDPETAEEGDDQKYWTACHLLADARKGIPVFEFIRDDGQHFKVWFDGRTEGFGTGIILNRIPTLCRLKGGADQLIGSAPAEEAKTE